MVIRALSLIFFRRLAIARTSRPGLPQIYPLRGLRALEDISDTVLFLHQQNTPITGTLGMNFVLQALFLNLLWC